MRQRPKPLKPKAKLPVASKSPKNQSAKVRDLEKGLAEALKREAEAQQRETATADILRVISNSLTDVQPVLDAVAESAARLCESSDAEIFRRDGARLLLVAHHGPIPSRTLVVPLVRETFNGRTVLDGRTLHVVDLQSETDEFPRGSEIARQHGTRAQLSVPLMREGVAIGTISLRRAEARLFTERQVALLQTFADQAVIAIENARLFNETKEALERQTATAEILRVISSSPTDVQPVFEAMAANAARLCDAVDAHIHRLEGDDRLRVAAHYGPIPLVQAVLDEGWRLDVGSVTGRAILEGRRIHVEDLASAEEFPVGREYARRLGHRTTLAVPLLRQGRALGAIVVRREEVRPFTDSQVELLQTFADQAVIAIENVRLFTELQTSNRDLTTALEQQTATGEILGVISSSPTDVQPVFDTIVRSAMRLLRGRAVTVRRLVGDELVLAAFSTTTDSGDELARSRSRISLTEAPALGQVVHGRVPHVVSDTETDPTLGSKSRELGRARGFRSLLVVPLLRGNNVVGTLGVGRREPGPFTEDQVALLQTFADQAVIAIENVRLFTELQEKNRALTEAHAQVSEALDQQTATSEVLKVISRSTFDLQPVLDTLIENATRLCASQRGVIMRRAGDSYHGVAFYNVSPELIEFIKCHPIMPGRHSITARVALERRTIHVEDLQADPEYRYVLRDTDPIRTELGVPIFRGDDIVGVIILHKLEVEPFTDKQIELVETFADQAVIAIENVRLFTELEARTAQLTSSVEELKALSEVGRTISSTLNLDVVLDSIVSRATQLTRTEVGGIYEYDSGSQLLRLRATHNLDDLADPLRARPIASGQGAIGRAVETRSPVQISDLAQDNTYVSGVRDAVTAGGYRALLAVPLMSEEEVLGVLVVNRRTPGAFSPDIVQLLSTFASQSALAMKNARLFREIEDKSRQLEVASQHKSEFLANMSHELRTPLNAILGFSEILSERMFGELNEKQEEYSKDIHASGQHLLSLINDILDLSKIEAGRMELELTDFHLPMALDNALTLVRERAGRRSITLQTNVDERLGEVRADERKIRQVVLNLLSNAIKFTPEGGQIEVAAVSKDGSVAVSVSDTGVGIAPEDQEAVFEEFRQVGTAEKKAEGTGLGLTLCRKFIELHGGRIWVKSQVGVGSTFTFTIPVRRGE